MKKGFTLIELITVVIIIAIMAALALPQYTRFIERSQASTAKNALAMIRKAEATYFALNSQYLSCTENEGTSCDLTDEMPEIAKVLNYTTTSGKDWSYSVTADTGASNSTFNATATRKKGVYTGSTIRITDAGEMNITMSGSAAANKIWE